MNDIYLSPAFTERSQEELQILRKFDDKTPYSLFWLDIVRPLLVSLQAKNILEVGPANGDHTRLILTYCNQFDARIILIEPYVKPELEEVVENSDRITLYAEKSHDALPKIDVSVDIVLLSGGHNYYTVFSDLTQIKDLALRQSRPFPVVLVRPTSWPYARRDMYYDPQSIPVEHRHDREVKGMTPWSSELEEKKFNWPYANAKKEGGPANGVLTAVEDFIKGSELSLKLFSLPLNHGLSILYLENSEAQNFIRTNLLLPPLLAKFLETFELARLNGIDKQLQKKIEQRREYEARMKEYEAYMKTFRGRTKTFLKKIIRL